MESKRTIILVTSIIVLLGVVGFLFLYKIPITENIVINKIWQSKTSFSELVEFERGEEISFQESLKKWTSLKATNGNSYIYSIRTSSWVGSRSKTEIEVQNGEVVSKKYEFYDLDKNVVESFTEIGNKIDSHQNVPKAKTIDQLYNDCSSEYLSVSKGKNNLRFSASTEGIMMVCGYSPIGCADDCFQGVSIGSMKWLSK